MTSTEFPMTMRGHITNIKPNGNSGGSFPVTQAKCIIGRNESCTIRLTIPTVAEKHCALFAPIGKPAFLRNIDSSSQTLVNGIAIKSDHLLNHLDIITIEGRHLRWEYPETSRFYSDNDGLAGSKTMAGMVEVPVSAIKKKKGPNKTYVASASKAEQKKSIKGLVVKKRLFGSATRTRKIFPKSATTVTVKKTPMRVATPLTKKKSTITSTMKNTPQRKSNLKGPSSVRVSTTSKKECGVRFITPTSRGSSIATPSTTGRKKMSSTRRIPLTPYTSESVTKTIGTPISSVVINSSRKIVSVNRSSSISHSEMKFIKTRTTASTSKSVTINVTTESSYRKSDSNKKGTTPLKSSMSETKTTPRAKKSDLFKLATPKEIKLPLISKTPISSTKMKLPVKNSGKRILLKSNTPKMKTRSNPKTPTSSGYNKKIKTGKASLKNSNRPSTSKKQPKTSMRRHKSLQNLSIHPIESQTKKRGRPKSLSSHSLHVSFEANESFERKKKRTLEEAEAKAAKAAKRLKLGSTDIHDKKKNAALLVCHGRNITPRTGPLFTSPNKSRSQVRPISTSNQSSPPRRRSSEIEKTPTRKFARRQTATERRQSRQFSPEYLPPSSPEGQEIEEQWPPGFSSAERVKRGENISFSDAWKMHSLSYDPNSPTILNDVSSENITSPVNSSSDNEQSDAIKNSTFIITSGKGKLITPISPKDKIIENNLSKNKNSPAKSLDNLFLRSSSLASCASPKLKQTRNSNRKLSNNSSDMISASSYSRSEMNNKPTGSDYTNIIGVKRMSSNQTSYLDVTGIMRKIVDEDSPKRSVLNEIKPLRGNKRKSGSQESVLLSGTSTMRDPSPVQIPIKRTRASHNLLSPIKVPASEKREKKLPSKEDESSTIKSIKRTRAKRERISKSPIKTPADPKKGKKTSTKRVPSPVQEPIKRTHAKRGQMSPIKVPASEKRREKTSTKRDPSPIQIPIKRTRATRKKLSPIKVPASEKLGKKTTIKGDPSPVQEPIKRTLATHGQISPIKVPASEKRGEKTSTKRDPSPVQIPIKRTRATRNKLSPIKVPASKKLGKKTSTKRDPSPVQEPIKRTRAKRGQMSPIKVPASEKRREKTSTKRDPSPVQIPLKRTRATHNMLSPIKVPASEKLGKKSLIEDDWSSPEVPLKMLRTTRIAITNSSLEVPAFEKQNKKSSNKKASVSTKESSNQTKTRSLRVKTKTSPIKVPAGKKNDTLQKDETITPPKQNKLRGRAAIKKSTPQKDETITPPKQNKLRGRAAIKESTPQKDETITPPKQNKLRGRAAIKKSTPQKDETITPPKQNKLRGRAAIKKSTPQKDETITPPKQNKLRGRVAIKEITPQKDETITRPKQNKLRGRAAIKKSTPQKYETATPSTQKKLRGRVANKKSTPQKDETVSSPKKKKLRGRPANKKSTPRKDETATPPKQEKLRGGVAKKKRNV